MKKRYTFLIAAALFTTSVYAQTKVKDGSVTGSASAPSSNAVLELESISRGFLLPRMTTDQMNAIATPTEGLVIYNVTERCVFTYNNGQWNSLCSTTDFCGVIQVGDSDDDTDTFTNPNTPGAVFSPADPQNTCALYVTEDGQTWTWNGSTYITKPVKVEPWWNKANGRQSESLTDHIYHLGSVNIGNGSAPGRFSLTVGNGNITRAQNSFAAGYKNEATATAFRSGVWGAENTMGSAASAVWGKLNRTYDGAHRSGVWGLSNSVWGAHTAAWGSGNRIFADATNSAAWGFENTINNAAAAAAAWGSSNTLGSVNGAVWGNSNTINGNNSAGWGNGNTINSAAAGSAVWGSGNSIGQYGFRSAAFGNDNTVNGANSLAFGNGNGVAAEHSNSVAMGSGVNTTSANQFAGRFSGGVRFLTVASTNASPGTGAQLSNGATAWTATSDRRAKSNIHAISHGLKEVMALKPSAYNYKGSSFTSLGLIAQDVLEVIPEVVDKTEFDKNNKEFMGIRYTELIPVLVKAIQEQQSIIEKQLKEISVLKDEAKNWSDTAASVKLLTDEVKKLREAQGQSSKMVGTIAK